MILITNGEFRVFIFARPGSIFNKHGSISSVSALKKVQLDLDSQDRGQCSTLEVQNGDEGPEK
jgi:hypothetical protein